MSQKSSFHALLALLFLSFIWGYNWVVMKLALPFIGAIQFAAIRTFFAAMMLFAFVLLLKKPLGLSQSGKTLVLGLLQTTGFVGFSMAALVQGGAGKVAVLVFIMPFWVLLLAWPVLGEKVRGLQWLAVLLAVIGLVYILEPWNFRGHVLSNVLAILAGLSWALAVILAKNMHHQEPQRDLLSLTAWQMLLGSIPLIVLALLIPGKPIIWNGTLIPAMAYNIVLTNGLGWLIWLYALQRLPAGVASMNALLIPVIAVLAAWGHLDEVPAFNEGVGMSLIAVALTMLAWLAMRGKQSVEASAGQD
ncbi:MAG: DMT family transporter [Methylophilaceae bacterium]